MRKKPIIFTSLQSQAVPVSDEVLTALERDLDESLLRNLVSLILIEEGGIAAFHGVGMQPWEMSRGSEIPGCIEDEDHDGKPDIWQVAGDGGCPSFSNGAVSPEDIEKAVNFLNYEKPDHLIAYSRGGAVAFKAFESGGKMPSKVTFVAPAWKRRWASVNPVGVSGEITHGTGDDKVPLKHSLNLSRLTGMPIYVHPGLNHVSILKKKLSPASGGKLLSSDEIESGLETLPDWGEGNSTPGDIELQIKWLESL
jgi:hypothetical protein